MMKPGNRPSRPTRRRALRHFTASLPMLLLRGREAVMQPFRAMLRENGLTEQQWRVLRALDTAPSMDATELARSTFLLGPSLSRILRDLEAQALIATEADEADQRRKKVRLAPAGLARIESIAPRSQAIYAEITDRFGEARLAELEALLNDLEASLARTEPDRGPSRASGRGARAGLDKGQGTS